MGARTFSDLITFTRASTGTYFDGAGVMQTAAVDQPRIDYDPATGEKLGLLVEEQRTNLLTYSEQFDNAAWSKTRSSVTANATTAPDGTTTADALIEDSTAANSHTIRIVPTVTAQAYTFSAYCKANQRSWVRLVNASAVNSGAYFDLSTGAVGSVGSAATAEIVDVGNGWYRCSVTAVAISGGNSFDIRLAESDFGDFYDGDGTSGIYLWGAQAEAGAFPTSYIPTTTAQVTRSADVASITGTNFSDWYRQEEGTLVCEYTANVGTGAGTNSGVYARFSGSPDYLNFYAISTANDGVYASTGGVGGSISVGYPRNGNSRKAAYGIKGNDFAFYVDNILQGVDTSFSMLTGITSLLLSGNTNNHHIKKLTYYPKRLTNAELQAMTA